MNADERRFSVAVVPGSSDGWRFGLLAAICGARVPATGEGDEDAEDASRENQESSIDRGVE